MKLHQRWGRGGGGVGGGHGNRVWYRYKRLILCHLRFRSLQSTATLKSTLCKMGVNKVVIGRGGAEGGGCRGGGWGGGEGSRHKTGAMRHT